jgi:hypothetical protein
MIRTAADAKNLFNPRGDVTYLNALILRVIAYR